jgi:hypothetical protein
MPAVVPTVLVESLVVVEIDEFAPPALVVTPEVIVPLVPVPLTPPEPDASPEVTSIAPAVVAAPSPPLQARLSARHESSAPDLGSPGVTLVAPSIAAIMKAMSPPGQRSRHHNTDGIDAATLP